MIRFFGLCLFSVICAQYVPIQNQFLSGIEIYSAVNNSIADLTFYTNTSASVVIFSMFSCFGSIDWSGGIHSPGNNPANTCKNPWTPKSTQSTCGPVYTPPYTFYFSMQGTSTYSSFGNISAVFDFLAYTNVDVLNELVPTPGNGGLISFSLSKAASSSDPVDLTVIWEGTGNENDSYSLWRWNSKVDPQNSGYNPYTGCGVKSFMTLVSPANYGLSVSDQTYTVTYPKLSRTDPFYLSILVERSGGYSAVYIPLIVNGVNYIAPSIFVLISCICFHFI